MQRFGILTLLLFAGCGTTGPSEARLGVEFVLAPNQTARVVDTYLTVGFRRVAGDSRCPVEFLCVVEGSAGVELDVFGSNARNPVVLESRPAFDVWTDGTYQVRLTGVDPAASDGSTIAPSDYRVRLVVDPVSP
jgi:hypothetical protein